MSERLFSVALGFLQRNDFEEARGALMRCVELGDPEWSPRAASFLGHLLFERRDHQAALLWLKRAIQSQHSGWASAAEITQALIQVEAGDLEGARSSYENAIHRNHHDTFAWAHFNLGTLHQQEKRWSSAITHFQAAMGDGVLPYAAMAANNLGYVFSVELRNPSDAEHAFNFAARSADPEQADTARRNLAVLQTVRYAPGQDGPLFAENQVDVAMVHRDNQKRTATPNARATESDE